MAWGVVPPDSRPGGGDPPDPSSSAYSAATRQDRQHGQPESSEPAPAAFREVIATADQYGKLVVWSADTGTPLLLLDNPGAELTERGENLGIGSLAFCSSIPRGKQRGRAVLAASYSEGIAQLWDAGTWRLLWRYCPPDAAAETLMGKRAGSCAFSPDGSALLVAEAVSDHHPAQQKAVLLDIETGEEARRLAFGSALCCTFLPGASHHFMTFSICC